MAAGLIASSRCRRWNRALLLSEVLAAILLSGFGCLLTFGLLVRVAIPFTGYRIAWHGGGFVELIVGSFIVCTDVTGTWSEAFGNLPLAAVQAWLGLVGVTFLLAVLTLGLTVLCVARRLESSRREEPPTARQLMWGHFFFAPRFWKSMFRSRMRRTLERDPIFWLERRSTGARVIKWGWCLFVVIAECALVANVSWYDLEWPQHWLLLLLALSLAASAAGSFRRERENGALELILVTPLSVPRIILGRLRGLWRQFLPASSLLLVVLAFLVHVEVHDLSSWWQSSAEQDLAVMVLTASTFVTLPVVGLYFSLARKHFLSAWLATVAIGLALPLVALYLAAFLGFHLFSPFRLFGFSFKELVLVTGTLQVIFALLICLLLYRNLRRRKFALVT